MRRRKLLGRLAACTRLWIVEDASFRATKYERRSGPLTAIRVRAKIEGGFLLCNLKSDEYGPTKH